MIEAIPLLDAEQKTQAQIEGAIKALKEKEKTKANPPSDNLTDRSWTLSEYVQVSAELGTITTETAASCEHAKKYRNLIHPAVPEREGIVSDEGSAHIAIGAAYEVIRERDQQEGSGQRTPWGRFCESGWGFFLAGAKAFL